uniref:Alpha-2-macroglobulin domain-containing protein n=1 Tax=Megaselia scalaris TaxID=36166 RepID=T1GQT0_MEGSC
MNNIQIFQEEDISQFAIIYVRKESLEKNLLVKLYLPTPVYYFINRGYDGVTGTLPTTEIYYTTTAIPPGAGFSGGKNELIAYGETVMEYAIEESMGIFERAPTNNIFAEHDESLPQKPYFVIRKEFPEAWIWETIRSSSQHHYHPWGGGVAFGGAVADVQLESAVFKGSDESVVQDVSPSEAPVRKEFPESWIWVELNKQQIIKIIRNCFTEILYHIRPIAFDAVGGNGGPIQLETAVFKGSDEPVVQDASPSEAPVRKEFPETWIWVELNKGYSGRGMYFGPIEENVTVQAFGNPGLSDPPIRQEFPENWIWENYEKYILSYFKHCLLNSSTKFEIEISYHQITISDHFYPVGLPGFRGRPVLYAATKFSALHNRFRPIPLGVGGFGGGGVMYMAAASGLPGPPMAVQNEVLKVNKVSHTSVPGPSAPIRKEFPENWIWEDLNNSFKEMGGFAELTVETRRPSRPRPFRKGNKNSHAVRIRKEFPENWIGKNRKCRFRPIALAGSFRDNERAVMAARRPVRPVSAQSTVLKVKCSIYRILFIVLQLERNFQKTGSGKTWTNGNIWRKYQNGSLNTKKVPMAASSMGMRKVLKKSSPTKLSIRKSFPETWTWITINKYLNSLVLSFKCVLLAFNCNVLKSIYYKKYQYIPGIKLHHPVVNRLSSPISLASLAAGSSGSSAVIPPVRKDFPESWIWNNFNNTDGELYIKKKVPDTITSWVITGFSLNGEKGLGLTNEPTKLTVFQPFFVTINLPYSVKRGEVISIPVLVFNYMDNKMEAQVTLDNTDKEFDFVEASNEIEENVIEGRSKSVQATTPVAGDAVHQMLRVEPEGVTEYVNKAVLLNLKDKPEQHENIKVEIPKDAVPDSEYVEVSVVGDLLGPTIKNLDKLVRKPYGCGEQNMVNFVPNILVLRYLTTTSQLTKPIEEKAKKFLEIGYERELSYKHDDGSYSAFGKSDKSGSTWLTAYVARSFHQAKEFTFIDPKIIEQALDFLVKTQKESGEYEEVGKIIDHQHGSGDDNGIALTSFVVMAFLENQETVAKYHDSLTKGLNFLADNIDKTEKIYSLAIAAYALTLAKHEKAEKALAKVESMALKDGDKKSWSIPKNTTKKEKDYFYWAPPTYDVEITSYALLAIAEKASAEEMLPIIKWLISQRNSQGGFSSTQDTVVGLQALTKFAEKTGSGAADMKIEFSDDQGSTGSISVNKDNSLLLQTHILSKSSRAIDATAKGKGT